MLIDTKLLTEQGLTEQGLTEQGLAEWRGQRVILARNRELAQPPRTLLPKPAW